MSEVDNIHGFADCLYLSPGTGCHTEKLEVIPQVIKMEVGSFFDTSESTYVYFASKPRRLSPGVSVM
jgi:hypothetical protein